MNSTVYRHRVVQYAPAPAVALKKLRRWDKQQNVSKTLRRILVNEPHDLKKQRERNASSYWAKWNYVKYCVEVVKYSHRHGLLPAPTVPEEEDESIIMASGDSNRDYEESLDQLSILVNKVKEVKQQINELRETIIAMNFRVDDHYQPRNLSQDTSISPTSMNSTSENVGQNVTNILASFEKMDANYWASTFSSKFEQKNDKNYEEFSNEKFFVEDGIIEDDTLGLEIADNTILQNQSEKNTESDRDLIISSQINEDVETDNRASSAGEILTELERRKGKMPSNFSKFLLRYQNTELSNWPIDFLRLLHIRLLQYVELNIQLYKLKRTLKRTKERRGEIILSSSQEYNTATEKAKLGMDLENMQYYVSPT